MQLPSSLQLYDAKLGNSYMWKDWRPWKRNEIGMLLFRQMEPLVWFPALMQALEIRNGWFIAMVMKKMKKLNYLHPMKKKAMTKIIRYQSK